MAYSQKISDFPGQEMTKLISYNCAAWGTTVERIKRRHGTLQAWLERHDVDILCLQETKISKEDLELNARKLGALDERDDSVGFDTFWAYPQMGSKQRKGLNGVATFVKKGKTIQANSQVFQDQSLDSEGRCLMTDHGEFVVFNVYVPYSGCEYGRLAYKMKMLKSLRTAMCYQRSLGKKVILAGDLNITLRGVDTTREARCIYIENILEDMPLDLLNDSKIFCLKQDHIKRVQTILSKLKRVWPVVKFALNSSLQIEQGSDLKYFNSAVNSNGNRIRLGKKSFNKPSFDFQLGGYYIQSEDGVEMYEARPKDALNLEELKEVVSKLSGNNHSSHRINSITNKNIINDNEAPNCSPSEKDCIVSDEEWNLLGKFYTYIHLLFMRSSLFSVLSHKWQGMYLENLNTVHVPLIG